MRQLARLGLLIAVVAACGPAVGATPPSEEAAIGYLNQLVELVQGGGLANICSIGSGTCPHDLRNADPTATPRTRPRVLGTWIVPSSQLTDGSTRVGGRVLKLCGVDGNQRTYNSELLVFSDGDRLISINTVYWLGLRIATSPTTEASPPPVAECGG